MGVALDRLDPEPFDSPWRFDIMRLINVNQSRRSALSKKTAIMVHRLPLAKARINIGQVVGRARVNKEYFILEKDGIPGVDIMDADELEDYLELQDPKVRRQIQKSNEDIRSGRIRPAHELLAEFQKPRRVKGASCARHQKA